MIKSLSKSSLIFITILVLVNLILAIYATPVFDFGDSVAYLQMGKTFVVHGDGMNFASRSPLYPLIIAAFLKVFSEYTAIKLLVVLQYFLVAVTAWLLYKIFRPFFKKPLFSMLVAFMFNFSFATIYYSNLLLTEILTVFLFISAIYILIRIYKKNKTFLYVELGILLGLLILARYNTIPVILTFFILLFVFLLQTKAKWSVLFKSFAMLILPILIIVNSWCFYNYTYYGFYNLFPSAGSSYQPRNVIVSSINPDNKVSKQYEPVLQIFLTARQDFNKLEKAKIKGGLSQFDKNNFLENLYDGYLIYLAAKPALLKYYNLGMNNSELELAKKLDPFYTEIKKQNSQFIQKCRYYSVISTFRASSGGGLPVKYGKINLNILPEKVFIIYKLGIVFISIVFWISFLYFIFRVFIKKFRFNMTLLSLFGLTISFWLVNFIFITVNDSNRFKFPTEPLIFGIFILSIILFVEKIKRKFTRDAKD